ncbi:hypothetical protein N0V90_009195 [Kalmusia sp. IMI 367209]|nr:hypothetical protein N0V90_009195 [Kalmusia sp. IMI 367209]
MSQQRNALVPPNPPELRRRYSETTARERFRTDEVYPVPRPLSRQERIKPLQKRAKPLQQVEREEMMRPEKAPLKVEHVPPMKWEVPRIEDTATDSKSEFCSGCRSINWSAMAPINTSHTYTLHKLDESSLPLIGASCPLCRFFGKLTRSPYSDPHIRKPKNLNPTPSISLGPVAYLPNQSFFTLYIDHYYHGIFAIMGDETWKAGARPQVLDPHTVDYVAMRSWLNLCQKHSRCGINDSIPWYKLHKIGLRVIDCVDRKVVFAPDDCKFVALSYVWGNSAAESDIDTSIYVNRFPTTIEDSITVTTKMGLRYLWVDRYIKYPPKDFNLEPWSSRSWTYQEGLLSKRKIIFTDHGVFYVCNWVHASEYISVNPLSTLGIMGLGPGPFSDMTRLQSDLPYETIIKEYTARKMSYESDALNACLGILQAKETTHIWGIKADLNTPGKRTVSLCWILVDPTTRRLDFPSWSWTGWNGTVSFLNDMIINEDCAIRVSDGNNKWLLEDYVSSGHALRDAGRPDAPQLLELRGFAILNLFSRERVEKLTVHQTPEEKSRNIVRRFRIPLPFSDSEEFNVRARGCLDEPFVNKKQLRGVIPMAVWRNEGDSLVFALLLKPDGDKCRRVGMLFLGGSEHWGSLDIEGSAVDMRVSDLWKAQADKVTIVVG